MAVRWMAFALSGALALLACTGADNDEGRNRSSGASTGGVGTGAGSTSSSSGATSSGSPTTATSSSGAASSSSAAATSTSSALSSSSSGGTCTGGIFPTVTFPLAYLEPAELLRTTTGVLMLPVHQGQGDESFVMTRSTSGTWSLDAIDYPPNREDQGFGVFLDGVLDAQDRLHISGTSLTGSGRELWHAVRTNNTWTHHLLDADSEALSTRMAHVAGATYVVYSGAGVRAVRITDDGTVGGVQTFPDSTAHTLKAVAVNAQGHVVALTDDGDAPQKTSHLFRRQSDGSWTKQTLSQPSASARHVMLDDDGVAHVVFQTASAARFDNLAVMRVSTSGQVLDVSTVENSSEILVGSITTARAAGGAWRMAYERNHYRMSPERKDLVVATQNSSGGWDLLTVLENHQDEVLLGGPMLLEGNVLHRVVGDPQENSAMLHRVICF
ncbi:MAG: hypothetical protein AB2A00_41240 [Myxococcota bacterium]